MDLEEYRSRMDVACEHLGMVLVEMGDHSDPIDDDQLVERAAAKLRLLYNMLVAAGLSEGILKAVMRS